MAMALVVQTLSWRQIVFGVQIRENQGCQGLDPSLESPNTLVSMAMAPL